MFVVSIFTLRALMMILSIRHQMNQFILRPIAGTAPQLTIQYNNTRLVILYFLIILNLFLKPYILF